ncbi:AAA_assoc domain-containing protein [Psidium guajava]|nr:AAA_assoc domain-containing protein [Psidium guajava]
MGRLCEEGWRVCNRIGRKTEKWRFNSAGGQMGAKGSSFSVTEVRNGLERDQRERERSGGGGRHWSGRSSSLEPRNSRWFN